jgi:hypothetical protein
MPVVVVLVFKLHQVQEPAVVVVLVMVELTMVLLVEMQLLTQDQVAVVVGEVKYLVVTAVQE